MHPRSRRPKHGPSASVTLHFAGSASEDSEQNGCASVIQIRHQGNSTHTILNSHPLGICSAPEARYLAIIFAIRSLLSYLNFKQVRYTFVSLCISGHDESIIHQLNGACCADANIRPLFALARSLADSFLQVSCMLCSRAQNNHAIQLANRAQTAAPPPSTKAIYYPNLCSSLPATIEGKRILVSNDIGTAGNDPNNSVDLSFLLSLPNGKALCHNMKTVTPLSILVGKVSMTIVGSVTLRLKMNWVNAEPDSTTAEFFVVLWLPVAAHVSFLHPRLPSLPEDGVVIADYPEFEAENFPPRYAAHPYWTSDTVFVSWPTRQLSNEEDDLDDF